MVTLGSIKEQVGLVLNVCEDDARVARYANRAEKRLLPLGKWRGTMARYRVCVYDACLTWPRAIETIESFAICDTAGVIRTGWWEFTQYIGQAHADCGNGIDLIDRGLSCTFDDVRLLNSNAPYLRLYADDSNDAGKRVLLKYIDYNGNKVFTTDPTLGVIEGEYVTLVAPPAYALSTYKVMQGGLYEVQKDLTTRVVRLYAWDQTTNTQYPLGYYEPGELRPEYRRSEIPGLANMSCCTTSSTCNTKQVTIRAKLKHVDVLVDTDSFVLTCEEALAKEVEAIMYSEPPNSNEQQASLSHAKAVQLLDEELRAHQGDGAIVQPRFQSPATWGAGKLSINNWS